MVRRKKRDIYGNWVWEDIDLGTKSKEETEYGGPIEASELGSQGLEWRDYLALVLASLETFLLPFVVLILILLGLILVLALVR
ncbi:MAG: hypothetical protein OK457_06780 [Thaumarchaeota archaeon]|nr:hypothetical protein [Nitrososphaerota archaeon]